MSSTRIALSCALGILIVLAAAAQASPAGRQGSTCLECHDEAARGLAGHPVFVAPQKLDTGLVMRDGLISCETCHRPHGVLTDEIADSGKFLRLEPPALCARCHRNSEGTWDHPHARYADTIHGGTHRVGFDSRAGSGPDTLSRNCLGCHDGSQAPDVPFRMPGHSVNTDQSHPIGVRQPSSQANCSQLVPAFDLDPAVRLYEGRVGCASCHRLFGNHRDHLAVPRERDRLCRSCHRV